MPQVTHQTVTLGAGRHESPDEGTGVMELASMLAGEPFTDRPRSVSRTIAAFLRVCNDLLGGERPGTSTRWRQNALERRTTTTWRCFAPAGSSPGATTCAGSLSGGPLLGRALRFRATKR